MNLGLQVVLIFGTFAALLIFGFPIAFSLLGVFLIFGLLFVGPGVLYSAYLLFIRVLVTDVYIAIPLFVFMATILQYSGMGIRLYDMLYKVFAGVRGGLAIGTIALCTLIAAITGGAMTGIITIGLFAFPEMEKRGYSRSISLGCIPSASALGPIIPPSTFMIIVGLFGQMSIGQLFMGGVFPGLLMSFMLMTYVIIRCWLKPSLAPSIPVEERASWREKLISLRVVVLPVGVIIMVLGSLYTGMTTPTEAGAMGALGMIIASAIYRQLSWGMMKEAARLAFRINVMIMWLIIGGTGFGALMVQTGLSKFIGGVMLGLDVSPFVIVIIMMIIPLIMGMFIDAMPIALVLLPIFMPIVWELGIDSLWFGVLFSINIVLGMVTPPFGVNLFYLKAILPEDVSLIQIYKAVIPFALIMIFGLFLTIIFPQLALWLPSTMVK